MYLSFPSSNIPTENETPVNYTDQNLPEGFSLEQNYPNPFNASTQIQFTIQENKKVVVRIYNVVGQVVATIADDYFQAGTYKFNWEAPKELPSGVFLYKLDTPEFSISKKLILMK
jgi:hypothetical protein